MLYIVSTPIGNMQDITLRALDVLKTVDLIAAEDTRHTKNLLTHFQINTPLTSYFEHNELKKSEYLLGLLQDGKNVALVTDAGTPGISDPGYRLVNLAKEHQVPMTVVPGPCALIAALSLSALPTDSFTFIGFLPVKSNGRQKKLSEFKNETRTIIFYESPHRILKTLEDIAEVLGDRDVVVTREITKKFEEVRRGKAVELLEHFEKHPPKGEFVMLLKGYEDVDTAD
ncbi:MAG: 16S rRNA (cytidine(1402)-2'-O)-methyltransferase [Candidatus Omnitrophica bacterium]|nr:16S rRNA (cytidine(1402)-2'-O)-methyltransferase [Candidatus Omnitrophota bacterium]